MKKIVALAALATVLAAPAFAQTHVQSSGNHAVTSGTGVLVTPGAPSTHVVPGATSSTISSTTTHVSGAGPAPGSSASTTTTVTRHWVNVPPGVEHDPSFQRWQRLK